MRASRRNNFFCKSVHYNIHLSLFLLLLLLLLLVLLKSFQQPCLLLVLLVHLQSRSYHIAFVHAEIFSFIFEIQFVPPTSGTSFQRRDPSWRRVQSAFCRDSAILINFFEFIEKCAFYLFFNYYFAERVIKCTKVWRWIILIIKLHGPTSFIPWKHLIFSLTVRKESDNGFLLSFPHTIPTFLDTYQRIKLF